MLVVDRLRILVIFDALPLHHGNTEDRGRTKRRRDQETPRDAKTIRINDHINLISRDTRADRSRARVDNLHWVEAHNTRETVDQFGRKDVLANGKEDGAAELLHKEPQRQTKRDVFLGQRLLHRKTCLLAATP